MLYNEKARKDGTVVEKVVVEDNAPVSTEFFSKVTHSAATRRKVVSRVVEYGPYIPTLVRLLEEGYFDQDLAGHCGDLLDRSRVS